MLFWVSVAFLTAAVAAVLLLPLLRSPKTAPGGASHDVEVYRDQLDELRRDEASGLISGEEEELARAEVARRLIAAPRRPGRHPARAGRRRRPSRRS